MPRPGAMDDVNPVEVPGSQVRPLSTAEKEYLKPLLNAALKEQDAALLFMKWIDDLGGPVAVMKMLSGLVAA